MTYYAERTGKALRVAPSNPETGGVDALALKCQHDARGATLETCSLICRTRLFSSLRFHCGKMSVMSPRGAPL